MTAGWVDRALAEHERQEHQDAGRPERRGSPQPAPGTIRGIMT